MNLSTGMANSSSGGGVLVPSWSRASLRWCWAWLVKRLSRPHGCQVSSGGDSCHDCLCARGTVQRSNAVVRHVEHYTCSVCDSSVFPQVGGAVPSSFTKAH